MNLPTPTSLPSRFTAIAAALLLAASTLHAQGPITENPEGAVRLKRIWYLKGKGTDASQFVGAAAGGVGDLNEDGFDDFFVQVTTDWYLFLGGETISTTPAWIHYSSELRVDGVPPVMGDFLGNGSRLIGLSDARCDTSNLVCIVRVYFYQPDRDSLLKRTAYLLDLGDVQRANYSMTATDLDNDGDDELIIMTTDDGHYTKVRIYAGGPDFDLSAPTLVITDDEDLAIGRSCFMHLSDFDGDGFRDLLLGFNYSAGAKVKFWWGSDNGPWDWKDLPDRILSQPIASIVGDYRLPILLHDFNGDGLHDRFGFVNNVGTYLWLSRDDGSQRTRPFDSTDVDLFFPGYFGYSSYGYIADSLGRYQALSLAPINGPDDDRIFMGGRYGPNGTWDAISGGGDGPLRGGLPVGDVNGDGWEDRIVANSGYGGPGVGAAVIKAGGPYIPNDDPTSHVDVLPSVENTRSFWVWPNPVQQVLHLAWRGDFKNPPVAARLYDMSGRLIAETHLQPWTGAIDWRVEQLSSGVYLLSILDRQGAILSTTSLLKE